MKKTIGATIAVLVLAALALAIIPATNDEMHWRWASYKDETASYAWYLKTWPEGRHAAEARTRYDERGWADAQAANTLQGFEQYVQLHGEGKHVAKAKDNIETLHWQEAIAANTIRSYQAFLSAHPHGRFAERAKAKVSALRTDAAPFNAALETRTEDSLRWFLENFPDHQKERDARQALKDITEGHDIVDALREKKIAIRVNISGLGWVSLGIRGLAPYPLKVRIPAGTLFVSANSVTTEESTVWLRRDQWEDVSLESAALHFYYVIDAPVQTYPYQVDASAVQHWPHQDPRVLPPGPAAELHKLMPVLERARLDFALRQAGVWIVTVNAGYDDLGRIKFVIENFPRVIDERAAARAMRLCDEAGIDITRKAIWIDRQQIIAGLEDSDLKAWLNQKK